MTLYLHQVSNPSVDRVNADGREYLTFPVRPLREMVYNYPEHGTDELLPAEHIAETVDAWAGTPITAAHPDDTGNGPTVANANAYSKNVFGHVTDPELDGDTLEMTAYVDIDRANDLGGLPQQVVEKLEAGESLSTSPGYGTLGDIRENGEYDGESYDLVQGPPVPDHVAIFPSDQFLARCTPAEGCVAAPKANALDTGDLPDVVAVETETMTDDTDPLELQASEKRRFRSWLLNAMGLDDEEPDEADAEATPDDDDCSCGDHTEQRENAEENETDTTDEEQAADQTTDNEETDMTDEETETETTEPEAPETDEEQTEEVEEEQTDEPQYVTQDQLEDTLDDLADRVAGKVKANAEAEAEHEENARIVANATDIPLDAAKSMDEEPLADLAEEHKGSADTRPVTTNYAAVPGGVDRTPDVPDDDDLDDVPAGGRSAYEARKNGGDD